MTRLEEVSLEYEAQQASMMLTNAVNLGAHPILVKMLADQAYIARQRLYECGLG